MYFGTDGIFSFTDGEDDGACVLSLFIMRLFVGLSWRDSMLCVNQLTLLWINFSIDGYMYYIGAIVLSHGGDSFF